MVSHSAFMPDSPPIRVPAILPVIVPVTLEGRRVRLEPLEERHARELFEAGRDAEIWRTMPRGPLVSIDDARAMIREALEAARDGLQAPFAIVDRVSGRAIGSTRYLRIRRAHRGLEIGWTWLALAHQRTAANTECKKLLLEHAFERLGALRVQLKTDARNVRSQRAIERIGAVREGVLRSHMVMPDGFVRDTVMYSVTAAEWPGVKVRLEELQRGHPRS
jgi:RimJ/RimL family protein N-acetyltransferase